MDAKDTVRAYHLQNKQRGRPPKAPMPRPKKEPQTELEKLQAENLRLPRLRMRCQKVKALVEEQEAIARAQWAKAIDELRSEYPHFTFRVETDGSFRILLLPKGLLKRQICGEGND